MEFVTIYFDENGKFERLTIHYEKKSESEEREPVTKPKPAVPKPAKPKEIEPTTTRETNPITKPTTKETKPITKPTTKETKPITKPPTKGTNPTTKGTNPTTKGTNPTTKGTNPTTKGTKPTTPKPKEPTTSDLFLPPSLVSKISQKTVEKEDILDVELTALLRAAYYSPYFAKVVRKYLHFRPLPIVTHLGTSEVILLPHQKKAMEFMRKREKMPPQYGIVGGILYMMMGLMKTMIAACCSIITPKKTEYPTLIVCSKSVMQVWKDDFNKFFQDRINVIFFHPEYTKSLDNPQEYDFVVTTYDVVVKTLKKPNVLTEVIWERIIADESQTFANHKTLYFKSMMTLKSLYKWCLTGTPIRNSHFDLWSQLRFCGCTFARKTWETDYTKIMHVYKLNDAIFELDYEDTNIILPEKKKEERKVILDENSRECYKTVLRKAQKAFYAMEEENKGNYGRILGLYTRLRQICIAPCLMAVEDEAFIHKKLPNMVGWIKDRRGTAGIDSPKMKEAVKIIKNIPKEEKVIVFSSYVNALELLREALDEKLPEVKHTILQGDLKTDEREKELKKFTSKKYKVLLMTYKIGSTGHNLSAANHIIELDPSWNNATHEQSEARSWRPGQTKEVKVYEIMAEDTIENKIKEICERKDKEAASVLVKGKKIAVGGGGFTKKDLREMFIGQKKKW